MDIDTSLSMKRSHPGGRRRHAREKLRREEHEVSEHKYDDEGEIIDDKHNAGGDEVKKHHNGKRKFIVEEDDDEKEKADVKEDGKRPRNDVIVSHGSYCVEGKMMHGMEDFLVAKTKIVHDYKLGLYAIFDGHSGKEAAEYLQGHLFENILKQHNFFDNPKDAVRRAYKETDDDILENVVGSRGGSTSVTVIVIHEKKQLVVAHVGDSRAVVCRNGKGYEITHDHTPEKEKDLVESKGGFVSKHPGNVSRVDGQLAMSRAFGDAKVKEHISSDPTVSIRKVDEDMEYLILASDGLWKVMSNQDVVECIQGMKEGVVAAKALVEEAVERGSKDDISCIVLVF